MGVRQMKLGLAALGLLCSATVVGQTLKVGDKAPDFSLAGSDGAVHRLADYAGRYVVLAFFPKAFTSG